jgi:hypothetical protein
MPLAPLIRILIVSSLVSVPHPTFNGVTLIMVTFRLLSRASRPCNAV